MIPKDFITEWRDRAPWVLDRQVEQDLVISRALVELFSRAPIADALAFRGGTALYKLHITPAARYSEDIDLVQTSPGGIGDVLDAIHDALDPWLGKPKWKQTEGRVTLNYRFESEDVPPVGLKLKVEINSREHFTAYCASSTQRSRLTRPPGSSNSARHRDADAVQRGRWQIKRAFGRRLAQLDTVQQTSLDIASVAVRRRRRQHVDLCAADRRESRQIANVTFSVY